MSAARLYWENKADFFDAKNITIPFAISVFPDELYQAPRSWAERAYPDNLIYYNKLDRGGHFAAWEQPELFADEMRAASSRCADQGWPTAGQFARHIPYPAVRFAAWRGPGTGSPAPRTVSVRPADSWETAPGGAVLGALAGHHAQIFLDDRDRPGSGCRAVEVAVPRIVRD